MMGEGWRRQRGGCGVKRMVVRSE